MAAEQWELAMEQKWPKTYHYYLEFLKQTDNVLEKLDKIQGRTWLDICMVVFLVALFAMTGKTDFQLNQIIQQNGLTMEALAKESAELKEQQNRQALNIQVNQQKLEEVTKEMAILQEQQQLLQKDNLDLQHRIEQLTKKMAAFLEEKRGKEITELKAKIPEDNQAILIELKALEQKAQMAKNELKQSIQQNGLTIEALVKEIAQLKTQQKQPILTIQTEQQDMEDLANEMAIPKEQLQQQNETIKPTDLIKVANPKGNN